MNKTDYIIRQIAKSYKKKYENYVVTRIWHLLNNLDIKFVTQQHITRSTGRALTDMYFPQIQLHIEVDESQHHNSDGTQIEQDIVREADIINATGHEIIRISIFTKSLEHGCSLKSIEDINQQIDDVVILINFKLKTLDQTLRIWDIEAEYNPQTYIERGAISVDDNVAFRTIADACNCFGHSYAGYQKASAKHAVDENIMLWFPKLYENSEWENEISLDESEIHEKKRTNHQNYFNEFVKNPANHKKRITFARVKSNLGDVMYRFKGVYMFDKQASECVGKVIYKRESVKVDTCKPIATQSDAIS